LFIYLLLIFFNILNQFCSILVFSFYYNKKKKIFLSSLNQNPGSVTGHYDTSTTHQLIKPYFPLNLIQLKSLALYKFLSSSIQLLIQIFATFSWLFVCDELHGYHKEHILTHGGEFVWGLFLSKLQCSEHRKVS
jgi:hypothetical protein